MSTVIKAGQAGKIARRLSTVDLADHLREATAVIEGAREQAARIMAEAEQKARRAVENAGKQGRIEGYEKGYAEGVAAGREAALEQGKLEFGEKLASLAGMFQTAIVLFDENKEQLRLAAEKDLLDFAVMTATKMTFVMGELHREAACENFRRVLSLVTDKTDLTIRCNSKDIETMHIFAETVLESARSGHRVRLVEDDLVRSGGCILRSGKAEVDASLDTQVAEMVTILIGKPSNA